MTTWGWLMRVAFGTAAVGITTAAGLLFVYQRALIYPSSFPEGSRTEVDTPEQYDLPYREMRLNTPDGEKLHVYVMLQQDGEKDEKLSEERPTIVMFMANAGNMGHRLPLAVVFYRRLGCNVVMLSYRGYGLSSGEASEHGLRIDAQTMLDWIQAHPILSKTKVIAYGQSIGGAVSIDLAARNSRKIAGLILENTYPKYFDIIASYLLKYIIDPDDSDLAEIQKEDPEKQSSSSAKDPDDTWDDERKAIL
ncbi:bem46 protein, variant [Malassezia psittaci]|uniref:Bem46 protein, variant n=1 Tax=Malassezia psittaci TaxID=1821823 RepID=A0AAF0JEX2_9BASI|nr:bem46 protein, variant [Malassezia psittaci]